MDDQLRCYLKGGPPVVQCDSLVHRSKLNAITLLNVSFLDAAEHAL